MIEFDVDMGYLLECDELDKVVLNDENGEHEPMEFAPIAATVGRCDTMELWHEWEQVLFANVSDEVAQDNLNECVHELLDKAATMGERNPDGLPIGLTVSNDGNLLNWVGENYVRQDAATVGDKPKDNPRNYNSDGTPKIPNMHIGADPDWVDWVARLKHEEPLNLKEAVEQLMFETICFGGDMGPNDCGGEHCPDEGMVYTNDFINDWVNKIAATVGAGTLTAEQVRECSKGVYFEGYSDGATHRVNGIEETDWQAIADKLNATVGAGTCHIEVHDNLAETEGMGDVWLECDECHWQMPLEPTTPRFKYCPNCGARVVSE